MDTWIFSGEVFEQEIQIYVYITQNKINNMQSLRFKFDKMGQHSFTIIGMST